MNNVPGFFVLVLFWSFVLIIFKEGKDFHMKHESVQQKNIAMMSSFSGSRKVYVEGSRPDIQVPMREISLSPTTGSFGEEENRPVRVYDTSGPYTDANAKVDIQKGLKPLRASWIREQRRYRDI